MDKDNFNKNINNNSKQGGISEFFSWIGRPFRSLYRALFSNFTGRKKVWYTFVLIILVSLFTGLMDYPGVPQWVPLSSFWNSRQFKLGLDLQGGSELIFQADVSNITPGEEKNALEGVRDVIERRVNFFGVSEPIVQTSHAGDSWRVIVQLPGVKDVNEAIKLIGETPILEFKEANNVAPTPVDPNAEKQAKALATDVLNKARKPGADFAALAKEYSTDAGSKDNGGDLGWFRAGVMVKEFEAAVKALPVNTVSSKLTETQFGYHIIKKTGERQVDEGGTKVTEWQASHILLKHAEAPAQDPWMTTELSGKNLQRANVEYDPNTGLPQVQLIFNDEGKTLFAAITKRNVGKQVAIFLDGYPISIPTVQTEITGGEAIITGDFSVIEAQQLAQRLNAGALPVPVSLVNQQLIDPVLGKESLEKSLMVGIVGIALVALFMILYYRLPGLLSVLALGVYTLITLAIFKLFVTLTLAGIAGYVLSVGMAVDANVLIFERLKEELKAGRSLVQGIEEGFLRAWSSIRDSNFSSIITSLILIWFGTSAIRGFAITLIIGILVSLFSAIVVTRTLLRLVAVGKLSEKTALFGYRVKKDTQTV